MRVHRLSRWLLLIGLTLPLAELLGAELSLTPASAAQLALTQNLELRAARLLIAEAEARAENTGKLSNPELSTELAGGRNFDGRIEIGVTQRFPVTARLRLARTLSAFEVELARLEIAARENRLAAEVQEAVVELIAARESIVLAGQQLTVTRALSESLENQAREGAASPLDAGQSRIVARELDVRLAALRVDETQAAARLATLLGVSGETSFTLPTSLELPSDAPTAKSAGRRPDLRLAEVAVEAGEAGIALARTARWEDIGVGVFFEGERGRDELGGREREGFVGLRFSVPLPLWQKGDAPISEKRASRDRFARQLEAFQLAVRNETHAAFQTMRARHAAARLLTTDLLAAAREQLAQTEAAFGRGEIDAQPLFRAREQLITLERSAVEARHAFYLAHLRWLAATGNLLPTP
jgi:outer membrane protein, heavy metal efflux system